MQCGRPAPLTPTGQRFTLQTAGALAAPGSDALLYRPEVGTSSSLGANLFIQTNRSAPRSRRTGQFYRSCPGLTQGPHAPDRRAPGAHSRCDGPPLAVEQRHGVTPAHEPRLSRRAGSAAVAGGTALLA